MLSAERSGYDNLLVGAYKSVSEGGWTVVAVVLRCSKHQVDFNSSFLFTGMSFVKKHRILLFIAAAVLIAVTVCAVAIAVFIVTKASDTDDNTSLVAAVVSTDCGTVGGKINIAAGGTKISTYRNIPYAIPPLKELRWKPSVLLSDGDDTCWDSEYNGTLDNIIKCVNGSAIVGTSYGVEDCLHLSVRTPDVNGSRPVIVWIHGGGLIQGHSEAPGYMADADFTEAMDAVTVNINYRLGLMGFMSVEEFWNSTTGNYANFGFSDQITALKWIAANIANFGGNPNSVTIIGESGGGSAVLGLLSSPKANNLFHKAISLSPAPFWNTTYIQANEMFKGWVNNTGCNQVTKTERLTCMQNLDILTVSNAAVPFYSQKMNTAYFDFPMSQGLDGEVIGMAVIDPTVVPQTPQNLSSATFTPSSKVKVILSNTAEEQGVMAIWGLNKFENTADGWDKLNTTLIERMKNIQTDGAELIAKMWKVYGNSSSGTLTPQQAWDTIATDLRGTCPINDLAADMKKSANHDIYRLYITHHIPGYPSYHSWDTEALFGLKNPLFMFLPASTLSHMREFQTAIQKLVKDFTNDIVDGGWETYPTNSKIMTDSAPWSAVVSDSVQKDQCAFWKENDMDQWGWQN